MPKPDLTSIVRDRTLNVITDTAPASGNPMTRRVKGGRPLRRLKGTAKLNFTVSATGPGAYHEDAPWNLLRRILLQRDGEAPVRDLAGWDHYILRYLERGVQPYVSLPSIAGSPGALVAEWDISIPMESQRSPFARGWAWPIPSQGTTEINLEEADPTVLFSTQPTTVTFQKLTIDWTQVDEDSPDAIEMVARASRWRRPLLRRAIAATRTLTAGTRNQAVPEGNIGSRAGDLEASLLIVRQAGVRNASGAFDAVRFILGRDPVVESTWEALQRESKEYLGLETLPAGVLYFPHDRDNLLDQTLPLASNPESHWEFDTPAGVTPTVTFIRLEALEMR